LLARVNEEGHPSRDQATEGQIGGARNSDAEQVWDDAEHWGESIVKKPTNTLRIGFQNIGGWSFSPNSLKDDIICQGINLWEFDIFGMVELNIDWRLIPEQDHLYFRMRPYGGTPFIFPRLII
jgi:hypothetical protein